MNNYPNNHHGYGQNASYTGYRGPGPSPASMPPAPGPHAGQHYPDSHYPSMAPHHGGSRTGYGSQSVPTYYGMSNYRHPYQNMSSGPTGHPAGMLNTYNSHGHLPPSSSGPVDGQNSYSGAQHRMGMINPQNHPSMVTPRAPSGPEGYYGNPSGAGYLGFGTSPSRMATPHQHSQVPVPQHPMRQTNAQQNPQEVADNILQMASAYPSNQTVQVPLKNRPAPYHIPRSPHFGPRPELPQQSSPSPHHQPYQQQAPSPSVPVCQTSSSPASTCGVRSPVNNSQRPPSHGSHSYFSPINTQASHYGSCSVTGQEPSYYGSPSHSGQTTAQYSSPIGAGQESHPYANPSGAGHNQPHLYNTQPANSTHFSQVTPYPPHSNHSHNVQSSVNQTQYSNNSIPTNVPSPCSSNFGPTVSSSNGNGNNTSNPLMSLEKLVMLPETQVVDPKSVVNEACLSSTQSDECPKNADDPAEQSVESSDCSVGSSSQFCSQSVVSTFSSHTCVKSTVVSKHLDASIDCISDHTAPTSVSSLTDFSAMPDKHNEVDLSSLTDTSAMPDKHNELDLKVYKSVLHDGDSDKLTSKVDEECNSESGNDDLEVDKQSSFETDPSKTPIVERDMKIEEISGSDAFTINECEYLDKNMDVPVPKTEDCFSLNTDVSESDGLVTFNEIRLHTDLDGFTTAKTERALSSEIDHPAVSVEGLSSDLLHQDVLELEASKTENKTSSTSPSHHISAQVQCHSPSNTKPLVTNKTERSECDDSKSQEQLSEISESKLVTDQQIFSKHDLEISNKICFSNENCLKKDMDSVGSMIEIPASLAIHGCTDLPSEPFMDSPVSLLDVSTSNSSCVDSPLRISRGDKTLEFYGSIVDSGRKVKVEDSPVSCCSPSVLSEVPINGVSAAAMCGSDGESELDCELPVMHSKFLNGLSSLSRSKLRYSRRAIQMSGIIPCSIAVGASERAVCESFTLRRNNAVRVTHNSSRRMRNNSSGNTDSDECLENFSAVTSSFVLAKGPQDGTRKRGPGPSSKRNGMNKTSNNVTSTSTTSSKCSNGATSYTAAGASDDDTCYYEGVDNSYDVYVSSDESAGSGEGAASSNQLHKPEQNTTHDDDTSNTDSFRKRKIEKEDTQEEENSKVSEKSVTVDRVESSTPSSKRLKIIVKISPPPSDFIDLTSETSPVSPKVISVGKSTVHSSVRFRPSILQRKSPALKYPVVVLKKSPVTSPNQWTVKKEESSSDVLNAAERNSFDQLTCTASRDVNVSGNKCSSEKITLVKDESENTASDVKDIQFIDSEVKSELPLLDSISPKKKIIRRRPRKRKGAKLKDKSKVRKTTPLSDATESFKSMKFSRTLDILKANKKPERKSIGPFIRLEGSRSCPKNVSVFAQTTSSDILVGGKQGKVGLGIKKGHSVHQSTVTSYHMVSDFPMGGLPIVPSTRTVSLKSWVCAFCGHQSSYSVLGDLFGPYFKENDVGLVEKISAQENKKSDLGKDKKLDSVREFRSPVLKTRSAHAGQSSSNSYHVEDKLLPPRKQRRKSSLTPRADEESTPDEFWVHQACALWSPGVCLAGSKMYGLEEAVKDAAENECSVCKSVGAMIGCLQKGCSMTYHFACAVENECYFDEENFSILCPKHKEKKLASASSSKS